MDVDELSESDHNKLVSENISCNSSEQKYHDWMALIQKKNSSFSSLHLDQLMVPGSHDSGSQQMNVPQSINGAYQTQFRNVFEQLCAGVRYLDLRIGIEFDEINGDEIDVSALENMDIFKIRTFAKQIELPMYLVADRTSVDAFKDAILH